MVIDILECLDLSNWSKSERTSALCEIPDQVRDDFVVDLKYPKRLNA